MKRRDFIKTVALSGVSAAVASAVGAPAAPEMICGKVVKGPDGSPAAGVVVSDGLVCVRTDGDGKFAIPERKGARFVSVTVPSGYRCNAPYLAIPRKKSPYYFWLDRWAASGRAGCKFIHLADSEIDGTHDIAWMEQIKKVAEREDVAFVVHTGDICRRHGMHAHLLAMNHLTMKRPVIYCLGNHDLETGPYGESFFETLFGPVWHSFEAGGIHFVVTPMPNGDYAPSYTTEDVADWIRNDLAMIPKSMPVVFFNHMISNWTEGSLQTTGFTFGGKRRVNLAESCNLTGFVYGHAHLNHFQRRGNTAFICTACPQMGGIGMAPATIRVIRADAKGRLDSTIHYGHVDEWKPDRAGAEWETQLPGKVLFGAPVVSDGLVFEGTSDDEGVCAASVTALDLFTGKVVWSHKMENSINNQIVVSGGILVAQDIEGFVTAFEAKTGRVAWRYLPPIHPWKIVSTGLALNEDGNAVFVGRGNEMAALEVLSGKVLWKDAGWKDQEPCADTPGVGDGIVVSSSNWNGMFCNDAATGKLLWSVCDRTRRFPGATHVIRGGRVYSLAASSFLEIDAKTGKTIREKKLPTEVTVPTRVLTTDRYFIFGTVKCGLLALDRNSLDMAWKGTVGESMAVFAPYTKPPQRCVGTAPLIAPDGTICATAPDGAIHFWNAADGRHLREVRTGAPYFAAPAICGNRFVAADAAGIVRSFML